MKQVVIMPGGFHPFHAGHYALYKQAQDAFPGADVYVAATNDTSSRPFPFALKEKLAKLAGVNPGKFIQVKSPFQAREVTDHFDPADTQLIFVRSAKDADKPPRAGGVKKDGNPAYLQPYVGNEKGMQPFAKHAYMAYLPTVEFGPGFTSATEIRTAWPTLNEKRKTALVMSLYPKTQKNPALAANVVKMLDTAMGSELDEDLSRRGFLRGLGTAALAGAAGSAMAQTMPNINAQQVELANKYYNALVQRAKEDGRELDRRALNFLKGKADDAAAQKFQQNTLQSKPQQGFPSQSSERQTAKDIKQFEGLNEFAPSDDSRDDRPKFLPWNEFIGDLEAILGDHFSVVQNIVKSTIKARFVPHDPMEFGPTMLYSYYETRAGRNKGAVSTRGSIQVGKYFSNSEYFKTNNPEANNKLLTAFSLLKGTPFERHFDLTGENVQKIADIIIGNTQGAFQMQPQQGVAEDYVAEKK